MLVHSGKVRVRDTVKISPGNGKVTRRNLGIIMGRLATTLTDLGITTTEIVQMTKMSSVITEIVTIITQIVQIMTGMTKVVMIADLV